MSRRAEEVKPLRCISSNRVSKEVMVVLATNGERDDGDDGNNLEHGSVWFVTPEKRRNNGPVVVVVRNNLLPPLPRCS